MRNLITDVPGLLVGHAHDTRMASGVTAILFDPPAVGSVVVTGGGPAGRDLGSLEPEATVARIDALVLSGGSAFGLDAASGAQAWLRARGRGLAVRGVLVPIVPAAALFDLLNGGDKDWGRYPPYRELGEAACATASPEVALGTVGAGYGATTVDLKGGLGSASVRTTFGRTVGALAAVNAIGSAVIDGGPHFWAAPYEVADEFGGLGWPARIGSGECRPRWKGQAVPATTLAVVATDATLDKGQARRIAAMASTGLAKALRLSAAPMDGDTVFAVSTCRAPPPESVEELTGLGIAASDCLARAVARGIHAATALAFPDALPAWADLQPC